MISKWRTDWPWSCTVVALQVRLAHLFASLAEVACWSSIFAGSLVNCWGRCKKCFWQTRAWHWPCTCWSDWISIEQSSHCRPTVCEGNGRAGVAMFFEALETLAYQASWEWPAKVSACQHSTSFVFVWRQFLLWLRAQIQSSSMHWSFAVTTSSCIAHKMLMCIQGPAGSSWSWWCGRGF